MPVSLRFPAAAHSRAPGGPRVSVLLGMSVRALAWECWPGWETTRASSSGRTSAGASSTASRSHQASQTCSRTKAREFGGCERHKLPTPLKTPYLTEELRIQEPEFRKRLALRAMTDS